MSSSFAVQLKRFGPECQERVSNAFARRYCRDLARAHYENFTVASVLLPRNLVQHFHNVYAYCRWADDLADEVGDREESLGLLGWWRGELRRCYRGTARHPVMVALGDTIRAFDIPEKPFSDLLHAFEQDQKVTCYQTFEQLLDYCRFSANPVGHLVLYLCGCFDPERAYLADQICTGLQLANFWQDVARDADMRRTYLPAEDRRTFGYSDEDLKHRRCSDAFTALMQFEADRTRQFFCRGMALVRRMPTQVQADIRLFVEGGLAILRKIEAINFNVWQMRPSLSKWDKTRLILQALGDKARHAYLS